MTACAGVLVLGVILGCVIGAMSAMLLDNKHEDEE